MSSKDWTGNKRSTFATLGASNHVEHERAAHDYYATDPQCADVLPSIGLCEPVWECACGEGHLSQRLKELGYTVYETDLIDRGVGQTFDFINHVRDGVWQGDIVTNPPYNKAMEFVLKAIRLLQPGRKAFMFLKLTFLEGQKRRAELFDKYPPKEIHVYSHRKKCAMNGDFAKYGSSATCYAWFVWEKGWKGEPKIYWI